MTDKFKKIVVVVLTLAMAVPFAVFAAPYDFRINCRTSDDMGETSVTLNSATSSNYALFGQGFNGECAAYVYVLGDNFAIENIGGGKYGLQVAPGSIGWDELDGGLSDILDSKAERTTVDTLEVNVGDVMSQIENMGEGILMPQWMQDKLTSMATTTDVSYEGTTVRTNTIDVFKNATVSGGTAVFHLTTNGLSGGTAIFPNGIIVDSIDVEVNDAAASYQMSYALSNSNKTITVTANRLTTANILSGILGQTAANGAVVRLMVKGY